MNMMHLQVSLDQVDNPVMLSHVRCKNHVEHQFAHVLLHTARQFFHEITFFLPHDAEGSAEVVVLIRCAVVVFDSPLVPHFNQNVVVQAEMLKVMDYGTEKSRQDLLARIQSSGFGMYVRTCFRHA
jgi:hypothetical protein